MADSTMAGLPLTGDWGSIDVAPPAMRWVLQGEVDGALAGAWGALPDHILASREEGGRAALKLGPDEWLLIGDAAAGNALAAAIAGKPISLVELSSRNIGIGLAGPAIPVVLAAGCPLDLADAAFPVGMATRTVFGKAEIVLWRRASDEWRIEAWRSFVPYIVAYLTQAVADL